MRLIKLLSELKYTVRMIKSDFAFHNRDQKKGFIINCIWHPSFRLLLNFRIGHFCYTQKFELMAALLKYNQFRHYSCYIAYSAILGQRIKFAHPLSIVIGEGVVIKDDVKIWQGVTLGSSGKLGAPQTYPTIHPGTKIYSYATILGNVRVGKKSIIGAGSLVLQDVPDLHTAIGSPARVIPPREN